MRFQQERGMTRSVLWSQAERAGAGSRKSSLSDATTEGKTSISTVRKCLLSSVQLQSPRTWLPPRRGRRYRRRELRMESHTVISKRNSGRSMGSGDTHQFEESTRQDDFARSIFSARNGEKWQSLRKRERVAEDLKLDIIRGSVFKVPRCSHTAARYARLKPPVRRSGSNCERKSMFTVILGPCSETHSSVSCICTHVVRGTWYLR